MLPRFEDRKALERHQEKRLCDLLRGALRSNQFIRNKLGRLERPPSLEDLRHLPLTTKGELVADQANNPPWGTNLTFELRDYTRHHRTSGTAGQPMHWLDTRDSWSWFLECWREVLARARFTGRERIFFAFSFGPFIGFWGAYEAAQLDGMMVMTGGAMTGSQRLDALTHQRATSLVCTPTYALHLASLAKDRGLDLASSDVERILCAGEPGASVPNVRQRIEEAWGARVYDHAGATELGAWGAPGDQPDSLVVLESEFIAEVIDPETAEPAQPDKDGKRHGELVLTNLGRECSPLIRYRTGDLVALENETEGQQPLARLHGGVLGRADDMLIVRGVNVYPSAIDDIVRSIPEIVEYRITVDRRGELIELNAEVEAPEDAAAHLANRFHQRLALRIPVTTVAADSLPRFELKAKRWQDKDAS